MSDNFPILIEVEEQRVGSVLRALPKIPGIAHIHLQLEEASTASAAGVRQLTGPKKPVIQRKVPKPGEGSGVRKLIAQALQKAPLHYKILETIVGRGGFSEASTASAITKMANDKEIIRVAPGTYRLSPRGSRAYHLGSVVNAVGAKGSVRTGLRFLILDLIQRSGGVEHIKLRDELVANGFSDANMYNMVPKMREEGLLVRHGDTYTITERGQSFLAEVRGMEAAEKPAPALENRTGEVA